MSREPQYVFGMLSQITSYLLPCLCRPNHEALEQEKRQSTVVEGQEIMDQSTIVKKEQDKEAQTAITVLDNSSINSSQDGPANALPPVPLQMKLLSVLLVSCIGFGSQWSSGVSSAMKSTMKKVCILIPNPSFPRQIQKTNIQTKGNAHQQHPILLIGSFRRFHVLSIDLVDWHFHRSSGWNWLYCLWQYYLHHWFHSHCWRCRDTQFQVHDCR